MNENLNIMFGAKESEISDELIQDLLNKISFLSK